jgi:tetratricopeptide (TPR) repeat protein
VLAAVGVEAPSGLPGRSLLQPPPAAVPDLYFESLTTALNRGWAPLRGVLRARHKLIDLPLPELYDLDADPGEARNLADRDRRQARELRAALPAASAWPPPGRGAVAAETAARLRSLGYVVGAAGAKTAHTAADDPKSLIGLDRELHRSIDLYSRGRYEEAAAAARRAIDQRPDMAEGYERLGSALRQLERHDEAIAALRDGLRRADQPSLRRQLGLALAEAGRAPDAVAVLEPLAPAGEPETLRALGVALSDAGRHTEAIALLERAAAADAGDPKVHEDLGIVALRLDRPAAARDHLRRALALNEALPISWNTLGVALYRLQDPPGAVAAWRRAVALDPQQYDALYNLGLVAAESGRGGEARQALERFVATAPPARFAAEIARARQLLARLPG